MAADTADVPFCAPVDPWTGWIAVATITPTLLDVVEVVLVCEPCWVQVTPCPAGAVIVDGVTFAAAFVKANHTSRSPSLPVVTADTATVVLATVLTVPDPDGIGSRTAADGIPPDPITAAAALVAAVAVIVTGHDSVPSIDRYKTLTPS